jgi:hypothetical protein
MLVQRAHVYRLSPTAEQAPTLLQWADWIGLVPVHPLQYALQAVEVAFRDFWLVTAACPKPHRKFAHDSVKLPAEDVRFTCLGKGCGAIRLPKIGRVKLRWHCPLGGTLKSERGGQLIELDAAYKSQTCSQCGCVDAASRNDQATMACVHCGHEDNADINAARNIARGVDYAHQPAKRTLRRVDKTKPSEEMVHVS